jgi:hypothetical protein
MPETNRKNRIISLRLSAQEYDALKALYSAHGARSISDFARSAMQRVIAGPGGGHVALELKVEELNGKVNVLDTEVARLIQLIESERPARDRRPS